MRNIDVSKVDQKYIFVNCIHTQHFILYLKLVYENHNCFISIYLTYFWNNKLIFFFEYNKLQLKLLIIRIVKIIYLFFFNIHSQSKKISFVFLVFYYIVLKVKMVSAKSLQIVYM